MTCAQGANAGHSLSTFSMIMLLEYLPQEPSDPVYGKLMSGGAAYEWEAQSQYRASPLLPASSRTALLAECCLQFLLTAATTGVELLSAKNATPVPVWAANYIHPAVCYNCGAHISSRQCMQRRACVMRCWCYLLNVAHLV